MNHHRNRNFVLVLALLLSISAASLAGSIYPEYTNFDMESSSLYINGNDDSAIKRIDIPAGEYDLAKIYFWAKTTTSCTLSSNIEIVVNGDQSQKITFVPCELYDTVFRWRVIEFSEDWLKPGETNEFLFQKPAGNPNSQVLVLRLDTDKPTDDYTQQDGQSCPTSSACGDIAVHLSLREAPPYNPAAPDWDTNPADAVLEEGQSYSFSMTATDYNGVGDTEVNDTENFRVIMGGEWGDSPRAITLESIGPLSPGNYDVRVKTMDIYGATIAKSYTITVTGPTGGSPPEFHQAPDNIEIWSNESLELTLIVIDEEGVQAVSINNDLFSMHVSKVQYDNVASVPPGYLARIATITATGLSPGTYSLKINAADMEGAGSSHTVTITVLDATPADDLTSADTTPDTEPEDEPEVNETAEQDQAQQQSDETEETPAEEQQPAAQEEQPIQEIQQPQTQQPQTQTTSAPEQIITPTESPEESGVVHIFLPSDEEPPEEPKQGEATGQNLQQTAASLVQEISGPDNVILEYEGYQLRTSTIMIIMLIFVGIMVTWAVYPAELPGDI